ncbi:MAG TPA: hypothetical protein VMS17_32160 [Gemmataceae bacterium]|nr:hypothetical protein [Gemmataceae bacterium]
MTKKLRRLFPKLFGDRYVVTSGRTRRYNCIAWALGRTDAWMQAPPDGLWPENVLDDGSVQAAAALFESLGFTPTHIGDVQLKNGIEKLAIYGDADGYTHVARQLTNGRWTSKVGELQDIEHESPDDLTSAVRWIGTNKDTAYGELKQIMRMDRRLLGRS